MSVTCPYICLYTYLYTCQCTCRYICLIHISVHMSVHISIHMSTRMSMPMSIHMSVHMSIHMCMPMSVHMSTRMSIHRSATPCACHHRAAALCRVEDPATRRRSPRAERRSFSTELGEECRSLCAGSEGDLHAGRRQHSNVTAARSKGPTPDRLFAVGMLVTNDVLPRRSAAALDLPR